jgi:hypothetical protein
MLLCLRRKPCAVSSKRKGPGALELDLSGLNKILEFSELPRELASPHLTLIARLPPSRFRADSDNEAHAIIRISAFRSQHDTPNNVEKRRPNNLETHSNAATAASQLWARPRSRRAERRQSTAGASVP